MTVNEYRHDDDDDDDDDGGGKHWCFQFVDRVNAAILLTFVGVTLTSVGTASWLTD